MDLCVLAVLLVCCCCAAGSSGTGGTGGDPSCAAGHFLFRHQCVLCHPTCSRCGGHELYDCTTCGVDEDGHERFLHQGRCRIHCPRGYFPDRGRRVCLPCIANCELCTDANVCAKCREHYKLLNGVCQTASCERGQVEDPDTGECLDCEVGCNACSTDNPEICSSCIESHFLCSSSNNQRIPAPTPWQHSGTFRQQCRRHCPQGTYEDSGRRLCQACPAPCTDCRSDTLCLVCQTGYFINDGECVKQCPRQTFANADGWRCQSCHASCQTCHGPRSTHCESCVGGNSAVHGQCPLVNCPEGQYSNVNASLAILPARPALVHKHWIVQILAFTVICCQHIDYYSCNSKDKIVIFTGHFLDQESSCVERCPLGSYANTSTQLCEACSPNCEGCVHQLLHKQLYISTPGKVLVQLPRVKIPHIQLPQTTITTMQTIVVLARIDLITAHLLSVDRGFFETAEGLCNACDDSCVTCDGTRTQCLSCAEGRFLESGACRLNCSLRTYPGEDGTCRRCPPHCDVCSDERTCFSEFLWVSCSQMSAAYCYLFLYLILNGACKASCPAGYYDDMEEGRCGTCHPTCSTCFGPLADDCETCSEATPRLYDGACSKDCPPVTYYETAAMECQECHQTCASCSGPEANQCTQCERGLVLDPNTLLCGVTGDTACPPRTYLHDDQFTCKACHRQCYSCGGPGHDQCQTCAVPKFLYSKHSAALCCCDDCTCWSVCPVGMYSTKQDADGTELKFCLPCDHVCSTCSGASPKDCLTCSTGYLRLLTLCISHCPTGYYREGSSCEKCDRSCEQCTGPGPELCQACSAPLLELQGTKLCVERCPRRFYQRDAVCHRCHISCQTCTDGSPQSCVTCDRGNTFKENVCYPRCGEGHYYAQEASRPTVRHCLQQILLNTSSVIVLHVFIIHCSSCFCVLDYHCRTFVCHATAPVDTVSVRGQPTVFPAYLSSASMPRRADAPHAAKLGGMTQTAVCVTHAQVDFEPVVPTTLCTEAPLPKSADLDGHASAALPAALLLALAAALTVFALVKARAKKRLCWHRSYERLSGSASGAMPHGVPEPDSGNEADVVYTTKGGSVYRRYSFYHDQDPDAAQLDAADEDAHPLNQS
ncbi:Proprotein convertase subtilisin/kexin type 5 [Merluccius polli]|uniref:Proprotein convertase subtilisin/kexin type 5 n=1 Tax=Merluccius polli TaxID=89951 RepID=A0AA47MZG5_MERPO|nr:Proprotein convertase subtilisin/kexin type 5 [Merluccius polli]